MRLSERAAQVAPSATKAMTAKAREFTAEGRDIIALTQGEPDFDTPEAISAAGIAAIRNGHTRYTPVAGIEPLREAIVTRLKHDHDVTYMPHEVIVGCGAKQVIANALFATLDPGDEVILPAPCWVTYPELVKLAGGTPVTVDCTIGPTFKLSPEQLDAAITPRTRWLILNTPSNPTGAVYTERELGALADVLRRHEHVGVLTDEIYDQLVYAPAKFASLAAVAPDLRGRILIVNGVSKTHAMTGWQVGWGIGPGGLIKAMTTIQGQTTSHTSSIAQHAALEAVGGDQAHIDPFRDAFRGRRDLICERINSMPGLSCRPPDGAFYVLVDCKALIGRSAPDGSVIRTDGDLAMRLLDGFGIAVVPGTSFLAPGFIRLSYAASTEDLKRACNRLQAACDVLMTVPA